MYLVFIQESPFLPKLNVKSKLNFGVLSNDIYQKVIECMENCRMNVCINFVETFINVWPALVKARLSTMG